MARSLLDVGQIVQTAFSDADEAIKVVPSSATSLTVEVAASDGDSIMAVGSSDGTTSGTQKVLRVDSNGRLDNLSVRSIVSVTPTVSNAVAYTANDQVGGVQTIASAVRTGVGTAILESITVIDKTVQSAALEIFFFNATPTMVGADNDAFDILDANVGGCLGYVAVAAADYKAIAASSSVATVRNIQLQLAPASGTSLFAVVKTTGTPTYDSTSALTFKYGFKQD